MENRLVLKVWKMDYSFIINNYLDQSLWQKTWTLFEYKDFTIQLALDQIMVRDEKLRFIVKCIYNKSNNNGYMNYYLEDVFYSLKINDVSFLKRAINSAIYDCIRGIEYVYFISNTDKYNELESLKYDEQDKLRNIAKEFLDNANVESDNCREAYIDAYIDENSKIQDMLKDYVNSRRFMELTDFWLVWINSLEDEEEKRKSKWLDTIHNKLGEEKWKEAYDNAIEYAKYMETEEFEEDMKSNLEEV